MSEFDEPIRHYESFFRDEHARNVEQYFEDLVKQANIDEQLNIETVAELRSLEQGVHDTSSKRTWWKVGLWSSVATIVALVGGAIAGKSFYYLLIAPAIGLLVLIFKKINPEISQLNDAVKELEGKRDEKTKEAWEQMAPLNALYTWDIARLIFMKSFPEVKLDPYFTSGRLIDLLQNYELSPEFNTGRSMLLTQSGSVLGNPFVVARFLQHWIGSYTYYGSLVIYWTETVRDAQGNYRTVQRSQTLTASVTKPFPEYAQRTSIIYGHESAPNLSFSRMPSKLSGMEEGLLNNWRKDHAIKKVEKKARKDVKTGDGQLTMMANKEFEAIFNAIDRDHEVEFRLLFTPLAQQQMVELLNDRSVGFGDDFAFSKSGMVNFVEPHHLGNLQLEGDPKIFHSLELAQARKFFNEFHNEYFRSLYFSFAPLFTIPLYGESRSMAVGKDIVENPESSFWEHEAMANYLGEANFAHPASVTRNILKTTTHSSPTSTNTVRVTAHGYQGIPRVDFIPMLGGDGNIHQVPVNWIEYIPVQRDSTMLVGAVISHKDEDNAEVASTRESEWEKFLSQNGKSREETFTRGALQAALLHD